jgi:biopolymer transport protein ExbB
VRTGFDLTLEALARRDAAEFEALGRDAEHSALNRVFRAGLSELDKVAELLRSKGQPLRFTPEVVEVLRSGIDGEIVRQAARMNRELVLLTLAVSAAPFLGLLGTVVGIMMTFGAITLIGDVNVNTIAPGVAAALITTVAGLAVAIPAMFGYNRLTTTIRELTTGMETFANELLARVSMANFQ